MANIYEVAELAGVSLATVSRVINPGAKVSEKTRQKVLAAMQQLGYQPNSIAQSLATRSSNAVGVLVSELYGPFFGAMLSAIEQTLKAAGKFVLVAAGHSNGSRNARPSAFWSAAIATRSSFTWNACRTNSSWIMTTTPHRSWS